MVTRKEIARIISGYENPRIGVLGSHSALEIMDGAKDEDFQTVVFCQKGREAPYKKFSRIADEIILVSLLIALFGPKEHSITKHWNSKFFLNCFIS